MRLVSICKITLFTEHLLMTIACQMPILKLLRRLNHAQSLMISGGFWILGFIYITITGTSDEQLTATED
jgi:hypothetical protein